MANDMSGSGMDEAMPVPPTSEEAKEVMVPKALLGDAKPGDVYKVKSIEGDKVVLSCEESAEPTVMSDEEMKAMKPEAAHKMPLQSLEQSLPKAERDY